jgi:hypothetical protein
MPRLLCVLSQSTLEREFWRGELPGERLRPPLATKRVAAAKPWGHMRKRLRHAVNQTRLAARTARWVTARVRDDQTRRTAGREKSRVPPDAASPLAVRAKTARILSDRRRRSSGQAAATDRGRRKLPVTCLGCLASFATVFALRTFQRSSVSRRRCSQSASFDFPSRSIPLDTRAGWE